MEYPSNPYVEFLETCRKEQSAIAKWLSMPEDTRQKYIRDLRYQMSYPEAADLIGNVLQELVEKGEPSRWIPVEEKMPPPQQWLLVWAPKLPPHIAWYRGDCTRPRSWGNILGKPLPVAPTHWFAWPTPPA